MLRIFANEPATFEAQLPVDECVDRLQRVIEAARRSAPEDARPIGRASRRRVVLRPPPGRPRKLGIAYPTIFVGRLVPHHRGAALTGIFTVSRLGKLALSGWFIVAAFLLLNGGLDSLRSGASIDRL